MRDLIVNLFGEYAPLTVELPDADGIISAVPVAGIAAIDWTWLSGVCLFGIVLFCFMRLVGVLLK